MNQLNLSEKNLRELEKVGQHYNKLKHQYDLKKHELDMIHERLQTTRHHQLAQEVEEMENQNQQLQNDLKEAKLLQDQGSNKMKELEHKIENAKELKAKEMKAAE